jgi:glycosyltransferase involved in cell wall biosynthesis
MQPTDHTQRTGGKRIALLQTQAEGAGAQEISRILGRGLAARGYEVHHVFLYRRTSAFDEQPDTVFCAPQRPRGPFSLAAMLVALVRHLKAVKPDAVLCFQHYGNVVGGLAARLAGIRIIIANRMTAQSLIPAWLRRVDLALGLAGVFRRIVVNSTPVEREYDRYPRRYRARVARIEHGFEAKTTELAQDEARRRLCLPSDVALVGSVARLHPDKNLAAAIRLLPGTDWHFAIAGQGPAEGELMALARTLGVARRVHFVGELPPAAIALFLRALDAFVFPSRAETFGLAAVEAAQAGVPVVANDLAVLREVLAVDGEPCAVFVDADDRDAFAAAVQNILDDGALRAALTRRGPGLARRYSLDAMVGNYAALIEELVRPDGAAATSPRVRGEVEAAPHGQSRQSSGHVALRVDPARLRGVHRELAERLSAAGARVSLVRGRARAPLPPSLELLLELERLVARDRTSRLSERLAPAALDLPELADGEEPDVMIDFIGDQATLRARTLQVLYDGVPCESVLIGALVAGRMPSITIADAATGAVLAAGVPCADNAGTIRGAMECVLARVVTLVLAAQRSPTAPPVAHAAARSASVRDLVAFEAKIVARAILHRLYSLCFYTPHWRTCWRFVEGPDLWESGTLADTAWHVIPDPGFRFYADPFPFVHEGRSYVFLEDLDHRRNKAVISVVPFGPHGPTGPAEPVLEEPWHLSYPFVFAHDGQVWMIPESSANRSIALYRAEKFPYRWVKEATLVSGVEASDATLVRHDGLLWMFAATRDGMGSWSDTLSLFSAPALHGPWRPHAGNPVLVDQAAARPAGAIVTRHGRLWRPVQDCAGGYGTGIGLAEITRLDHDGFAQRVHAVLRADPAWPGRRLHTLNRAGRLECIDGSAYSPRSPQLARRLEAWSGRRAPPAEWSMAPLAGRV